MMYVCDSSALNAVVLHMLKYPYLYEKNDTRCRRIALENLALELIKPCIKWRVDACSIKNFSGIQNSVINSIIKTGEVLCKSPISPNKKLEIAQYCYLCTRDRNRSKYKITCKKCNLGICQKYTYSFCKTCFKKL